MDLRLKFWGTRGWVSSPRPETSIYGGNTPSLQIFYKDHLILFDTGFGVSNLGEELLQSSMAKKQEIHIFYSHFHWDHIQGLPFFHPIYFPHSKINIYSPWEEQFCYNHLDVLFDGSYSPFDGLKSMPSKIEIIKIPQNFYLDGLMISFCPLNHLGQETSSYAYKITAEHGQKIVLASDHEASDCEKNDYFLNFCKNSNLLVHDAHYTESEYQSHQGWGHSSMEQALMNAKKAQVGMTLLTHHAPNRDDLEIEEAKERLASRPEFQTLIFQFAKEGPIYKVPF